MQKPSKTKSRDAARRIRERNGLLDTRKPIARNSWTVRGHGGGVRGDIVRAYESNIRCEINLRVEHRNVITAIKEGKL
jgi:hypothetical protein